MYLQTMTYFDGEMTGQDIFTTSSLKKVGNIIIGAIIKSE